MKLLIIGFNARPIAKLAKKAGYDIGVVDYFGDIDLLAITKNCFSVLRQKPDDTLHRPLHRSPSEYLYYLAEIMIEEQNDFDGILIGSSFDKYPEIIKKLHTLGPMLLANTPEKFTLIRDYKQIQKIASDVGFNIPTTIEVKGKENLEEEAKNHFFPLVTRSGGGGGGIGIKYWASYEELKSYLSGLYEVDDINKSYLIQEFVSGSDASASVLCSNETINTISLNHQIIGDINFNAPSRFTYCGNIVPLQKEDFTTNNMLIDNLYLLINEMFEKIKLLGSNGIDFVIKDNEVYFMEINPRFQGSLECVEIATGINIVKEHVKSFLEKKLAVPKYPKIKRTAIKGILFSNSDEPFKIKNYPSSKCVVDRTHYNVIVEKGDPICSIVKTISEHKKGYENTIKLGRKIIEMNQE